MKMRTNRYRYPKEYQEEDFRLLRDTLHRCQTVLEKEELKKQIENLKYLVEVNPYSDEMSMDLLIKCYEIQRICDEIERRNKKKAEDDEFYDNFEKLKVKPLNEDYEL